MLIANAIMILVSAGALLSLRWMRKTFSLLEKITYFMVIVIAIEQIHSAVPDNYKLFKITETVAAFVFFKLNQLIVFPLSALWLMYSFFHPKSPFLLKALLSAGWILGLTGAYWLFQRIGVFTFTGWKFKHSVVLWSAVLAESACFCAWFRMLLRKSDGRDAVSS